MVTLASIAPHDIGTPEYAVMSKNPPCPPLSMGERNAPGDLPTLIICMHRVWSDLQGPTECAASAHWRASESSLCCHRSLILGTVLPGPHRCVCLGRYACRYQATRWERQSITEPLGFPHPSSLPAGEGVHGASLTVSTLLLAPMPSSGKDPGGSPIAPHGPRSAGWSGSKCPRAAGAW
jgi:hypothetical protein